MKSLSLLAVLALISTLSFAQGEPSKVGQTTTPQAASAADKAVQARHDKVEAKAKARAAKRAGSAASGN